MNQKDRIVRRIQATAIWTLGSVAHFGGEEGDEADMTLLRDSRGVVYIPGTSLAGVGRAYLARCLQSRSDFLQGKEPRVLEVLFGGAYRRGDEGTMSALLVEDGLLCDLQGRLLGENGVAQATSLRDGVRLNGVVGVAADTAKYDVEVLERGKSFLLCFTLLLREELVPQDKTQQQVTHEELLAAFDQLLAAFELGEIALGAKTRRGYGRGNVPKQGPAAWNIADLSMNHAQDILAWLKRAPQKTLPRAAFSKAVGASSQTKDQRCLCSLEAEFEIPDALLIRSVSEQPDSADVSHLRSGGRPIVSGTSWAGALRHQSEKILLTLGYSTEFTQRALCRLFGSLHQGDLPRRAKAVLVASRLRIEESEVTGDGESMIQTRVAIDRFTGGAADTALFEEEPLRRGQEQQLKVHLRVEIDDPHDGEIGLLCLLLKDLWYGLVPVGGTVSVGRGHLRGVHAKMILRSPDLEQDLVWEFTRPQGKNQMQANASIQRSLGSYVEKIAEWIGKSNEAQEANA